MSYLWKTQDGVEINKFLAGVEIKSGKDVMRSIASRKM
jgi:hypothetical protein